MGKWEGKEKEAGSELQAGEPRWVDQGKGKEMVQTEHR